MPLFVDTDVLVYFRDSSEPAKQQRAREWLTYASARREARTSVQVLHEFYVVVTRKLRVPLAASDARRDVRDYLAWRPLALDEALAQEAWDVEDRYQLSFWDCLVVAAARRTGCQYLLTEDLQDGQDFEGTEVVNPFAHIPSELTKR